MNLAIATIPSCKKLLHKFHIKTNTSLKRNRRKELKRLMTCTIIFPEFYNWSIRQHSHNSLFNCVPSYQLQSFPDSLKDSELILHFRLSGDCRLLTPWMQTSSGHVNPALYSSSISYVRISKPFFP